MTDSRFDEQILLIRQGVRSGLKEIYDEYGRFIYSVMLSAVRNSHNAEDLTSDFFIKLWEKLADTYKSGRGHKRWLAAAAHNMAIDFLRKNGREQLILDDENENGAELEPQSEENSENTVIGGLTVKEALEKLSPSEREIVNLKLFGELTFKEISQVLGKPLGTVTWKYQNAVKKLGRYIKEVES